MPAISRQADPVIVISADCHAGPSHVSDFEPYTPASLRPALHDYVARIDEYEAGREALGFGGARGGAFTRDDEGLWDSARRTAQLEADGVVAEVLFPQGSVPFAPYPAVSGPKMEWTATTEQRHAGPEIYNRWLADLCSADFDAHFGVAVVPIRDVEAAVKEVERARESGLKGGISLPPIGDEHPGYNDPVYDPLWAACQDNGMVLNIHGGAGITYRGGSETIALTLSETDFFSRRTLWFLIFGGVFERFPNLRLAITEQRAHWVPSVVAELDSIYRSPRCAKVRDVLPKLPSEYFASNCYIGASFMSRPECEMRHQIGVDRIMWGSDYPHTEGVWPWVNEGLRWTYAGVPEPELRRMLGENAIDCYGFDAQHLRVKAAVVGPAAAELTDDPVEVPPDDPGVEMSWAFRLSSWS